LAGSLLPGGGKEGRAEVNKLSRRHLARRESIKQTREGGREGRREEGREGGRGSAAHTCVEGDATDRGVGVRALIREVGIDGTVPEGGREGGREGRREGRVRRLDL